MFRPLTRDDIGQIVTLELNKVQKRLVDHNIKLEVTEAAKNYLADEGLRSRIRRAPVAPRDPDEVEDALSDGVLSGKFKAGER